MFKTLFATGALLAATAGIARVEFPASGVSVGGSAVTEDTLQLRDAGNGTVLASRNKVESLGGLVEVTVGDGRTVTLEPGARLSRDGETWVLSAHGGRPLDLRGNGSPVTVTTPALVRAVEGGWQVENAPRIEGSALHAAPYAGDGAVAAGSEVPPDDLDEDTPLRSEREKKKRKLNRRRVFADDPQANAEAADEQALKRLLDVSPSGF
ncbi:MAG: hypothetical protein IT452_23150 [Planctomycetia bacterium]|nr:hypothetical protein [Planctomycetia bacterium]